MIITAILNRVPAPYFNVSMVIAGGQEVKGLLMTGLVLLWGWENGLKSMYVSWLLLIKMRAEKKEPAGNMWRILRGKGHGGRELTLSNMEILIQYSFSLKKAAETWSWKYW